jgi:tetratricopeptide (TPR) repeat protein
MSSPRQAEAEFKQALKISPNHGEALMGLAETYRTQGKKAEAIRYYERYLEVLPNGPDAPVARNAIQRLKE